MSIEFADPGYNWAFVWWPLLALVLAVTAFILTSRSHYVRWDMGHWVPSILGPLMVTSIVMFPVFSWLVQGSDYNLRVDIQKASSLLESGFDHIVLSGDRFTAATEDGKYFEGVLVDLRPESGYAYRVLELTETGD